MQETTKKQSDIDIRNLIIKKLKPHLLDIKQYGVKYFDYRIFYKNGKSFGFTDNDNFYIEFRDHNYWRSMGEYVGREIIRCKQNKSIYRYIIRTLEDSNNLYLQSLISMGMSNSLGFYQFMPDRIEYFFYLWGQGSFIQGRVNG